MFVGIDPGQNGAICQVNQNGKIILLEYMPNTETDIFNIFESIKNRAGVKPKHAIIENVHAMPNQGVASTFKFGKNYGFLRACLIANKIPFSEETPQKWQKQFITKKSKNESKTQFKNRLKQKAQQLFPNIKFTLKNADAALIALHCYNSFR